MSLPPLIPANDPAKVQRAASHPKRPGDGCRAAPGTVRPVVNRNKCEGKSDCVQVCPYDVFEVGPLTPEEFGALSWSGRLKARSHGLQTSHTPHAEACRSCGLCVVACPEDAIHLEAQSGPHSP